MEKSLSGHKLVTEAPELAAVAQALKDTEVVGVDIETTSLSPRDGRMRLLQLAIPDKTFVVDVFETGNLAALKEVLEGDSPVKALHNSKFDYAFLKAEHGIELSPIFDTMLATQLLDGGEYGPSYALETVAERYAGIELDKSARGEDWSGKLSEAQIEYAARDAAVLLPLRERLKEVLKEEGLGYVSGIEFRAVATIAEMELAGIKLDVGKWRELERTVRRRRDEVALALDAQFPAPEGILPLEGLGPRLNLNSPQQITEAFRSLGIELADTRVWTLLKVDHPAARLLLEYRELQKRLGTYLETYPSFVHPKTGRIHANFLQCRVPTGRLACTSPNIQQVPHEDEFRSCFVAEEGNVLVIADYSQIELRILAEVSGDPGFVQAFQEGEDLHRVTAATMFGVKKDEVTKEQRSAAKRINFGLAYGRGAKSLSAQLGIDEERARALIDEYFANYPKVQRYLQETANEAMRTRTLRTLSGRVRKFRDPSRLDSMARGAMRREAMNYPIQGCVVGSTRIFDRRRGYVPIKSLVGERVEVWDGEKFVRALVAESGHKKLVKVRLRGGYLVECSPDHKFLTINNQGNRSWRKPSELRPGKTRVALADPVGTWSVERVVPEGAVYTRNHAPVVSVEQIENDARLGELLGRIASDGTVGDRVVSLLVAEHEEAVLPELLETCRELAHVGVREAPRSGKQKQRLTVLTISSASLARQLRAVGIKEKIPELVWSNETLLAGYLRGLFDGDGTVNEDNAVLVFCSGDRHASWARQVQEALLLLDIQSRVRTYQDRTIVQILKRDMPTFAAKVGFLNPYKQRKAEGVNGSHLWHGRRSEIYGVAPKVESVEDTGVFVPMYDVVNSETKRFAANGVITHNTSADIAKLALGYIREELEGLDARLINCIHDEFVAECIEDVANEVAEKTKAAMERAGAELLEKVPVEVEVAVSPEWRK